MSEEELEKKFDQKLNHKLNRMVDKAMNELIRDVSKADHSITKLAAIARYEGYGIALKELGADTKKLGMLVETEARKIEQSIRLLFK